MASPQTFTRAGEYRAEPAPAGALDPPQRNTLALAIKRAMDLAGALVGLMVGMVAYLGYNRRIRRESGGSVIFRQARVGEGGRVFEMYKLPNHENRCGDGTGEAPRAQRDARAGFQDSPRPTDHSYRKVAQEVSSGRVAAVLECAKGRDEPGRTAPAHSCRGRSLLAPSLDAPAIEAGADRVVAALRQLRQ